MLESLEYYSRRAFREHCLDWHSKQLVLSDYSLLSADPRVCRVTHFSVLTCWRQYINTTNGSSNIDLGWDRNRLHPSCFSGEKKKKEKNGLHHVSECMPLAQ